MSTDLPGRDEYPAPDPADFDAAVKAVLNDDDRAHHGRGRYTAHRTYTEHNPDSQPGDKVEVVRVEACDRDVIADIPVDHADEVLAALVRGRQPVHPQTALNEIAQDLLNRMSVRWSEKAAEHGEEDWLDDRASYHTSKARDHVADAYLAGGHEDHDEARTEAADAVNHLLMFLDLLARGGDDGGD